MMKMFYDIGVALNLTCRIERFSHCANFTNLVSYEHISCHPS